MMAKNVQMGGSPDTALSYSTLHTPHSTLTLTLNTLIFFCPHSFFLAHTHFFANFHPHSVLPFLVG